VLLVSTEGILNDLVNVSRILLGCVLRLFSELMVDDSRKQYHHVFCTLSILPASLLVAPLILSSNQESSLFHASSNQVCARPDRKGAKMTNSSFYSSMRFTACNKRPA
jgi:hypothetical protein